MPEQPGEVGDGDPEKGDEEQADVQIIDLRLGFHGCTYVDPRQQLPLDLDIPVGLNTRFNINAIYSVRQQFTGIVF